MLRVILALCLAGGFLAAGLGATVPAAADDTPRAITKIAGDLYRFQNRNHYSVFYVTSEGVIVTDPIDAAAATWLKAEIARTFNRPIRYLVYSHDHRDHIAGGEVFAAAGAVVVAHANAKSVIIGEKRPTAVPHITFDESLTIELGGRTVELYHVGNNHSNNSIVMRFPAEKVLFAVDFIPVRAVAFRTLPDAYLPDWIKSLARVERLDFDILAPGHGKLGTKADVVAFREYMTSLHDQTLAAARAGKSLEETQKLVDLSKYKDWGNYQNYVPMNIEGAYRLIQQNRRGN